jgi:hypothetical protein
MNTPTFMEAPRSCGGARCAPFDGAFAWAVPAGIPFENQQLAENHRQFADQLIHFGSSSLVHRPPGGARATNETWAKRG